jgi:hypothetical protein
VQLWQFDLPWYFAQLYIQVVGDPTNTHSSSPERGNPVQSEESGGALATWIQTPIVSSSGATLTVVIVSVAGFVVVIVVFLDILMILCQCILSGMATFIFMQTIIIKKPAIGFVYFNGQ